jgi:hypothetical protein
MTLPLSGPLEASDINVELGRSATAVMSIKDAATGVYGAINTCSPYYPNATAPHAYSEWYGYNHNAPCLNSNFAFWDDITTGSQNQLYSFKKDYWTDVSSSRPSPRNEMTISFWMDMRYDGVYRGGIMQLSPNTTGSQVLRLVWDASANSSISGVYDALITFTYTDSSNNTISSKLNLTDANNFAISGISPNSYWDKNNVGIVDTNGYALITIVIDYSKIGTSGYASWYWNESLLDVPWQNGAANGASFTFGPNFSAPNWTNNVLYVGGNGPNISAKCQLDGFAMFLSTALTAGQVSTIYNGGAVASISDYQNISTNILFYNFESDTPDIGLETGGNYGFDIDELNTPKRIQDPAA